MANAYNSTANGPTTLVQTAYDRYIELALRAVPLVRDLGLRHALSSQPAHAPGPGGRWLRPFAPTDRLRPAQIEHRPAPPIPRRQRADVFAVNPFLQHPLEGGDTWLTHITVPRMDRQL